jgi:cysteine-S-conjugate beta-lyase
MAANHKQTSSRNTVCVHGGQYIGEFHGVNTPIYTSTSYGYLDTSERLYPRYFNIPNQKAVIDKIALLEHAEDGIIFSSGMAAVSSVLLSFLGKGDHCIFQNGLYGGTLHFVTREFERFGIAFTVLKKNKPEDFQRALRKNTRIIYIESPSNPLLSIIDLKKVAQLSRENQCVSVIDNTFASPVNQNPIDFGIDVVVHSATKYLGGHSDICAGIAVSNRPNIARIKEVSMSLGGSLNAFMCYLLERSMKTLAIRVEKQNHNAGLIAAFLQGHPQMGKVYYPGLKDHEGHAIAKDQMHGYGGMLSFELAGMDVTSFQRRLRLIRPSMSLGGVESIICAPAVTSHRLVSKKEREEEGIRDNLLRLSAGIEETEDLLEDLKQALAG